MVDQREPHLLLAAPLVGQRQIEQQRLEQPCAVAQATSAVSYSVRSLPQTTAAEQSIAACLFLVHVVAEHWLVHALITKPITGDKALLHTLPAAGLSTPAVVALAQWIAFLSYQGRLVGGLQALKRWRAQ